MALTLEPITMSMYSIYNAASVGLCQSPSEESSLLLLGRVRRSLSVALWEGVRKDSLCLFPCDGTSSPVLGGVSKRLLRAMNRAWLAVRGSLLSLWEESSELLPVTPLAFPDLALDLLGGVLALHLGGSGVDVLMCRLTNNF